MIIGYARVSTIDQSLNLQLDALKEFGCEEIFQEKLSGAKDDRPELLQAIKMSRAGDKFVVYKLDRLARSTKRLIEIAELLREKGVEFVSIQDNIDTGTAAGKAIGGVLGPELRGGELCSAYNGGSKDGIEARSASSLPKWAQ